MSTTGTATTTTARIAAIRAAAAVRAALGQAATYQQLDDGRHQVQLYDHAAHRLVVGIGATAGEAIGKVGREHGGPQT